MTDLAEALSGLVDTTDLSLMTISDEEFRRIAHFIHSHVGISLPPQKKALVVGRLQPVLHARGLSSFSEYMNLVEKDKTGKELSDLVTRISTNHTHFYRESAHFDVFVKETLPFALKALRDSHSNDLRVWCAASSSGEEAYTLQMLIMETLGSDYSRFDATLLATDISLRALSAARAGIYPRDSIQPLPNALRERYFRNHDAENVAVRDEVKKQVLFRRFNLTRPSFPFNKPFHAIFCRNVMIYFDADTRAQLVSKFCDLLVPGGWLFVGHSESLHSIPAPLEYVSPAIYRRKGA